jgi:hypothetical protein
MSLARPPAFRLRLPLSPLRTRRAVAPTNAAAPAYFAAPAYSCLSWESVSDCWMRSTILPSRHGQARVDLVVLGGHVVYARVEVGDAADHPPQREATARLPKGHPALGEPDADLPVAFGVDDLVKGVEAL